MPSKLDTSLKKLYKDVEPYLEENTVYYASSITKKYGASGESVHTIKNGEISFEGLDLVSDHFNFLETARLFPLFTKVKYTLEKGKPIKADAFTPQMLLEDIQVQLKNFIKNDISRIEGIIRFSKKTELELDILERKHTPEKVNERDRTFFRDEAECLYHALKGKINILYVSLENDVFIAQSQPSVAGLMAEYVLPKEDLTIDENNIEAIYTFLESGSDQKIAKALEILEKNKSFYTQAEKRYLNWIRARLSNPKATLKQFGEAAPSKSEINSFLDKNIAKDYLSFSYFSDSQSKLFVDFIGSMIKNTLDIEEFIKKAKNLESENDLKKLYKTYAQKAKKQIASEAKIYTEGWLSKISSLLVNLKLKRILFEKTSFKEANASLVLREYMFYININSESSIYMDIFQSTSPDLTEVFWLLPKVPDTNWGDVKVNFPPSPLKFERHAIYKEGDSSEWEVMTKP